MRPPLHMIAAAALAAAAMLILAAPSHPAVATSSMATSAAVAASGVFPATALLPGDSVHTSITVPAASIPVVAFMRLSAVTTTRTACTACTVTPPPLDAILILSAAAGDSSVWSGTLRQLETGITLPGGTQPANHTRTYALTLTLPTSAGNEYQDLTVHGELTWGGLAASGALAVQASRPVTRPSAPRPADTTSSNSLSSTGTDILSLVGLAALLTTAGAALLIAGRRHRSHAQPGSVPPRG